MRFNLIKRIIAFLLMLILSIIPSVSVLASEIAAEPETETVSGNTTPTVSGNTTPTVSGNTTPTVSGNTTPTPTGTNRGYIRAKLTYEYDEGVTGLSDDIVDFVEGWTKKGDWYYYDKPLVPGDKVRFISCVHVPETWGNEMVGKCFKVIVTAEASEVAPKDTGWDENTDILYSKTFDLWSIGYEHDESVIIQEGKLTIDINEYQLDSNGNEVIYENDKIIVPGQAISKIVEFVMGGTLGGNIGPELEPPKLPDKPQEPEKPKPPKPPKQPKPPIKLELPKLKPKLKAPVKTAELNGVNVDGVSVEPGSILTYQITVKNPLDKTCIITIIDPIDSRLMVTDTGGGIFTEQPINGMGGILKWELELYGHAEGSVCFTAKVDENVNDTVIPNVAEARLDNMSEYGGNDNFVKSNAPIVEIGSPSIIEIVAARATYDTAHFLIPIVLCLISILGIITVVVILKRRNKKAEGKINDRT